MLVWIKVLGTDRPEWMLDTEWKVAFWTEQYGADRVIVLPALTNL